ncbi:uncharacterized protein LOC131260721 [Anopheles coustani]|uniref:uncharacterized protein LOC131260721 n=1 Tax=Anopheles coustani TaxID=139045 RepID=UPI002657E199|nr:uncharacterized protein LOC131260721 [Anopheles coustani]
MEAEKLRDIVLNAQQPYVITKKKLPWNCFELTLEEWCHLFDSSSKDLTPFAGSTLVGVENQVYHTVLEPGMALIVPPKWWHFVENLEPSLNFNTWLSLEKDVDSHISECITKILVQDICNGLPKDMHQFVLNPNEDEILSQSSIDESYEILNYLLNLKRTNKQLCSDLKRYPSGYISSDEFGKLVEACESEVKAVPLLDPCDFFHMMKKNSSRYDPALDLQYTASQTERLDRISNVININCDPDTVAHIEKML